MRKYPIGLAVLAFSSMLFSCNNGVEADKAETSEKKEVAAVAGTTYAVDSAASLATWVGGKPTGDAHTGTFNVTGGTLSATGSDITGGNFTISIASLNNKDLQGEYKTKLEGHLKSADFFDIAKYPNARFAITEVSPFDSTKTKSLLSGATHIISGNLTLRDSTKNIAFPAKVNIQADQISANADFNIDRTQWGMFYNSDASIQDKFINKEVNIKLNIVARK